MRFVLCLQSVDSWVKALQITHSVSIVKLLLGSISMSMSNTKAAVILPTFLS